MMETTMEGGAMVMGSAEAEEADEAELARSVLANLSSNVECRLIMFRYELSQVSAELARRGLLSTPYPLEGQRHDQHPLSAALESSWPTTVSGARPADSHEGGEGGEEGEAEVLQRLSELLALSEAHEGHNNDDCGSGGRPATAPTPATSHVAMIDRYVGFLEQETSSEPTAQEALANAMHKGLTTGGGSARHRPRSAQASRRQLEPLGRTSPEAATLSPPVSSVWEVAAAAPVLSHVRRRLSTSSAAVIVTAAAPAIDDAENGNGNDPTRTTTGAVVGRAPPSCVGPGRGAASVLSKRQPNNRNGNGNGGRPISVRHTGGAMAAGGSGLCSTARGERSSSRRGGGGGVGSTSRRSASRTGKGGALTPSPSETLRRNGDGGKGKNPRSTTPAAAIKTAAEMTMAVPGATPQTSLHSSFRRNQAANTTGRSGVSIGSAFDTRASPPTEAWDRQDHARYDDATRLWRGDDAEGIVSLSMADREHVRGDDSSATFVLLRSSQRVGPFGRLGSTGAAPAPSYTRGDDRWRPHVVTPLCVGPSPPARFDGDDEDSIAGGAGGPNEVDDEAAAARQGRNSLAATDDEATSEKRAEREGGGGPEQGEEDSQETPQRHPEETVVLAPADVGYNRFTFHKKLPRWRARGSLAGGSTTPHPPSSVEHSPPRGDGTDGGAGIEGDGARTGAERGEAGGAAQGAQAPRPITPPATLAKWRHVPGSRVYDGLCEVGSRDDQCVHDDCLPAELRVAAMRTTTGAVRRTRCRAARAASSITTHGSSPRRSTLARSRRLRRRSRSLRS